jgi:hypothetical protein
MSALPDRILCSNGLVFRESEYPLTINKVTKIACLPFTSVYYWRLRMPADISLPLIHTSSWFDWWLSTGTTSTYNF